MVPVDQTHVINVRSNVIITVVFSLQTIISFNGGNNQRLGKVLVELTGCFIGGKDSICQHPQWLLVAHTKIYTQLEKVEFMTSVYEIELTKTKTPRC